MTRDDAKKILLEDFSNRLKNKGLDPNGEHGVEFFSGLLDRLKEHDVIQAAIRAKHVQGVAVHGN